MMMMMRVEMMSMMKTIMKKRKKKTQKKKKKFEQKPKKPKALTEAELNGKIENYAEQFSLDQLAQTNINLNNLTFQMLKERQSQMSSQQPSNSTT